MTQDEIVTMAKEAGLVTPYGKYADWIDAGPSGEELVAFYKLAVAHEREACAKIVEENANRCGVDTIAWMLLSSNAEAIRARGQQ